MLVSLELLAASSDIAQSTHAFASCAAHSGSHAGLRFLSLIFDQPAGSIFAPQATPARSIFSLSLLVLGICGAIFLIVAGLLLFTLIRYRHRRGYTQREPAQIYGSTQIELSWTVIPILIVVVLFLATARVIFVTQTAAKPSNALDVVVIGHQYLVGVPLSETRRRHGQRTAHSRQQLQAAPTDLSDHVVGRHRPQLLGAAAGRKDGLDPEQGQHHVDRP